MNLVVNKIQQRAKFKDVNKNEVITALHQLRDNPDRINLNAYKNGKITWRHEIQPTLCWFPGCMFTALIATLAAILVILLGIIFKTYEPYCCYFTQYMG